MSSAATLAVIIPPSIPMILYAVMAETSVVQLFVAGIVPGVLGGFMLMATALLACPPLQPAARRTHSLSRACGARREALLGVPAAGHHPGRNLRRRGHGDRRRRRSRSWRRSPSGFSSIASSISRTLRQAVLEGGVQTAVVMLLVATSALLGTYLTEVQAPQQLARQ